ncbi:FeoA family protein [Candidatus Contubernalis alkaliaceticus]|uniref:FeoA family protein n=1 Tax=Candidatus Contubernalis alkaliaceticus TaxID=338645 RepID=UPI001F4C193A|nr:ferrous iron transport protein A [Candidatus Contubernalis alkalaceticus]UNC93252.1 ferrous iron transport protein A [Candidatus Contubernalis alkalaceticus]
MTLDKVKKGQSFKVVYIPDEMTRSQAIRFGIAEGEILMCEEIIPAGPIVVRKERQEIALGRNLCKSIDITTELN